MAFVLFLSATIAVAHRFGVLFLQPHSQHNQKGGGKTQCDDFLYQKSVETDEPTTKAKVPMATKKQIRKKTSTPRLNPSEKAARKTSHDSEMA
jgi:hypothetical protein